MAKRPSDNSPWKPKKGTSPKAAAPKAPPAPPLPNADVKGVPNDLTDVLTKLAQSVEGDEPLSPKDVGSMLDGLTTEPPSEDEIFASLSAQIDSGDFTGGGSGGGDDGGDDMDGFGASPSGEGPDWAQSLVELLSTIASDLAEIKRSILDREGEDGPFHGD